MMKRYFLAVFAMIAAVLSALAGGDGKSYAQATFPETVCDLGIIKESKGLVKGEFEFTNTGNSPLIIIDVKVTCGCTHPEFPKRPIAPGKSGKIKITYNPAGVKGGFRKALIVKTNGREKRTSLYVEGSVVPKK